MVVNHNEHFDFDKLINNNMNKIYFFHALLNFSKSLIGIFVPVFLYSLGFRISEIVLFSIGSSVMFLLTIPYAIRLINKIGFKYTILISVFIYIFHIITLKLIELNHNLFHLVWISFGIYCGIFWPAYHSELSQNGNVRKRGHQIGTLQILTIIFSNIAYLLGGFFLEQNSLTYLILLIFVILGISLIPLLKAPDIKLKNYNFEYKTYLKFLDKKKLHFQKSKKVFIYEGLDHILINLLWPILVFILLDKSFLNYGLFAGITSLISVILIIYFRTFLDKSSKHSVLKKLGNMISFNWFLKSVVYLLGMIFLYFVHGLSKVLRGIYSTTFFSIFYNNAHKIGFMDYIICREFYLHTAKIIFGISIIIILNLFGEDLNTLGAIIFSGVFVAVGISKLREF